MNRTPHLYLAMLYGFTVLLNSHLLIYHGAGLSV